MKKVLTWSLLIGLISLYTTSYSQYSELYLDDKKKAYQDYLKNHEYKNRPNYTKKDLKEIPKKDRPDLANEQNFLQTMDPATGTVPYDKLIQAHKLTDVLQAQNKTSIPGITWVERGPNNFGGRTRALMWDPNDGTGRTVFAGGVAGGLWKNTNITISSTQWVAIDDFWDNLAITALAYDPSNTQIMYAGTGEGFYNADAVYGGGIWKSTDGGTNWTRLSSSSSYLRITRIAVASNGDVYASTNGNGIIRSTDGGGTWATVLSSSVGGGSTSRAGDVQIGADGTIYAGMGIFSTDGIYSSTNGTTWTKLNTGSNGFPTSDIRRIEIACAPSNANVIYVVAQDGSDDIKGIYKTTNKGSTWSSVSLPNDADGGVSPDYTRNQAWYDLSIEVDPNDANTLFVGGIDLFQSTNGGSSWSQVSHWYGGFGFQEVHADQHVALYKPGSSSEIIFGNDGGVYYSSNATAGMPTIATRNNGYNVTQFYAGAINGTSGSNNMLAGAQDNGTHKFTTSGVNSTSEVTGGDGAFCHIDQSNGNNQISQYVRNVVYRTTNNWSSGTAQIYSSQATGLFINPSDYDDKEDIYYSGHANGSVIRLLRIDDPFGSANNSNVIIASGSDDVSHITCSQYAANGNSTVFVGTDGGDVYKVTNAQSGSPTVTNIGSGLPAGNISCIALGASEQQLLVTLSNYNTVSVWESTNGGSTWTSKEGNLPNMPVRWALYNPLDYTQAFLATEVGVWSTDDLTVGSVDWSPTNTGLANCRTDMLQYRSADNTILAATHGRGLFTTTLPTGTPPVADFSGTPTTLCEGNTVAFTDLSTNTPTSWSWSFSGGTPATSTAQNPTVTYNTAGTYQVQLTATNAFGSDIETKTGYITVNGSPSAAGAITGTTSVCDNATGIGYSISAVSGATGYTWTVPAGAIIQSGQNTTSITVDFGTTSGNVEVTPTNSCGSGTASNLAVTVSPCGSAPVADFSGTPTTLCEGNTVSFTDLSTNVPTSWSWSFPGGTPATSTAQNPTVTYSSAGTYQVQLTATNAFGSDIETKVGYITVNECGLTSLRSKFAKTYSAYSEKVACYKVANAQEYEFEFKPSLGGPTILYNRGINNPSMQLGWVAGLVDGTTYDVRVRAKVGGSFGAYGISRQLTTPGISSQTELKQEYCGINYLNYGEKLVYYPVANAQEYELKFSPLPSGSDVIYNTTYNSILLSSVSGLVDNTTYNVVVRVKVGGVYGPYGNNCQITTPFNGQLTSLKSNYCGLSFSSMSDKITCYSLNGAVDYQWEFDPIGPGGVIYYNHGNNSSSINLINVTGLQLSTIYDVRVRPDFGFGFESYGPSCQITTPATLRTFNQEDENESMVANDGTTTSNLTVYPNPSQGEFIYVELQGIQPNSRLSILDVSGKIIEQRTIDTDADNFIGTIRFEQNLKAGFYFVVIHSGDSKISEKLIVR